MPIAINGSGTVTGISVGGLPDGIVDTDMIAADAVTAAKIGSKTFTSYAVICDQKSGSSDGGGLTNGAWRTRDLNTEISDVDNIVSISSNQFTLQAGTYLIEANAPACQCGGHQIRMYNATDTATVQMGSAEFARSGAHSQTESFVSARVTITGAKAFEIQHRVSVTRNDYGAGVGVSGGLNWGEGTVYCIVKIYKEA